MLMYIIWCDENKRTLAIRYISVELENAYSIIIPTHIADWLIGPSTWFTRQMFNMFKNVSPIRQLGGVKSYRGLQPRQRVIPTLTWSYHSMGLHCSYCVLPKNFFFWLLLILWSENRKNRAKYKYPSINTGIFINHSVPLTLLDMLLHPVKYLEGKKVVNLLWQGRI